MHLSSLDNMRRCIATHLLPDPVLSIRRPLRVLDVGGADVNGNYRSLFEAEGFSYAALDLEPGEGVDFVQRAPHRIALADSSVDVVVSGQMLEHCDFFWVVFEEMVRVCRGDGMIVVIAPSGGPIHRYPVDCYRFLPDSFDALARYTNIVLVDCWRDPRGPWHDLVGVFRKSFDWPGAVSESAPAQPSWLTPPRLQKIPPVAAPEHEATAGAEPARSFLARIHTLLEPRRYLEIGVFMGESLGLASCPSVGIDPDPHPVAREKIASHHRIVTSTSDDFFFENPPPQSEPGAPTDPFTLDGAPVDLCYVDGMHLAEFVLKDFVNIEMRSVPGTLVIIDDVFPNNQIQASRERQTQAWTGDVWKIVPLLRRERPDLLLLPIDTAPTGSLLIAGLDARNVRLVERFSYVVGSLQSMPDMPPSETLTRRGAFSPHDRLLDRIVSTLKKLRDSTTPAGEMAALKRFVADAMPRTLTG